MRKHYIIISLILGLGLLGALVILLTAPGKTAPEAAAGSTPTPDRSDNLSGGSIQGRLAFSRQGRLWVWQGNSAHPLKIDPGGSVIANYQVQLIHPVLSPDGTKLAYIRQDESFSDLWVAGSDGSSPRTLTGDKGTGTPRSPNFTGHSLWAFGPSWSPDGTEIAYLSDVGTDDLTLRAIGLTRSTPRIINNHLAVTQGGLQHPSWSPQGDSIAVAGFEAGKSQIYSLKAFNGQSSKLTDQSDGAYDPAFSPDGNRIAFVSRQGNTGEIWLMNNDGSNQRRLTAQPGRNPVWSPDGKKLAFLSLKDDTFEIYTIDLTNDGSGAAGTPQQLTQNAHLDGVDGISWSK